MISVGNITTGGTGKTPLVAWIVNFLKLRGSEVKPAILTRGYRAEGGQSDEATLLERLTGVPVIVNADRVAGAAAAVAAGANVLVMDDGFQHRRLKRDLDIVTIDATCPFGFEKVLPRGLLREPLSALKDCQVIVITRCDQVSGAALADIKNRLSRLAPTAIIAESVVKPVSISGADGKCEPASSLAGKKIWAFCGLGNPEAFYRTLSDLRAQLVGQTTFNDHHAYSAADLHFLTQQAQSAGADLVITTSKDAVKLAGLGNELVQKIHWLQIDVEFICGQPELEAAIVKTIHA